MNKLMGFLELREISIPTIKWEEFTPGTELSKDKLWTIRSAKFTGRDLSLPRMVGKSADECMKFANSLCKNFRNNGLVIYYPYFVAVKSGTLMVMDNKLVIEGIHGDLWNMVETGSNKDIVIYNNTSSGTAIIEGDRNFFINDERKELEKWVSEIRKHFKNIIFSEKGVLLEWSFARDCDLNGNPVGEQYLVFYEVRSV